MAIYFDDVKTNIPGVGYRAYIWSVYLQQGIQCTPNPFNVSTQCQYLFGESSPNDSWQSGGLGPLNGIFPNVGEWVTINIVQSPISNYTICFKLLEIIDEATFNTGTCVSCYNNGAGGTCSDAFITVPPYPGDPNGCLYNNTINPSGLVVGSLGVAGNPGYTYTAWISSDCSDCTGHIPSNFTPNMVVNCCDPTETYILDPIYSFSQGVLDSITGTGVNQIGVSNFTESFRADLYTGGNSTGYKCWHLKEEYPPFGPTVYTITIDPIQKYPDCGHLNNAITAGNQYPPCCGTPPMEWCCMTGIAGPAGPTTCSQVAVGSCVVGQANVSAGPFLTQQLCVDSGCATVVVVDDCELPAAKLNMLQGKISKFTDWKNKSLGR